MTTVEYEIDPDQANMDLDLLLHWPEVDSSPAPGTYA
jgi:hypothetical protein